MAEHELETLLAAKFARKYVESALKHFRTTIEKFQLGEWEDSIAASGKFVEATLKGLWSHVGKAVPSGKAFKAGAIIDGLANEPCTHDDTIRLTIPRACRLIYEVASNRGGRHDAGDIDPNQMDATMVVSTCSWILAEMLRFAQKGAINLDTAAEIVASLSQRKYPFLEDVDGRLYFYLKGLSAKDVEHLTLWRIHPRRMSRKDLIAAAKRHGNSEANAAVGISRLKRIVDDDGEGNLKLLIEGVRQAEVLIASKRPLGDSDSTSDSC
jgi:hypothetical protein